MRRLSEMLGSLTSPEADHLSPPAKGRLSDMKDFGSNPGALGARVYTPEGLRPGSALVVALHGCTQSADAYDQGTGWSRLADRASFAVLLPEQRRSNNANGCFNWFEPADMTRNGGEAQSIAQMVEAMTVVHGLDRSCVYVTGLSAGGAMTAVMLAAYPDVFAGGAIIGGLAYGCASNVPQALSSMRGRIGANARGDADMVRRAAAGVSRTVPTVSIWHGDADVTVAPSNLDRLAVQWRAVHDLPTEPGHSESGANWERRVWRDQGGRDAVETWCVKGMGHGVPLGGPSGLGRVGPYMLDVGISSTEIIAASWGLTAAHLRDLVGSPGSRGAPRATLPTNDSDSVQNVIENALPSAGRMR